MRSDKGEGLKRSTIKREGIDRRVDKGDESNPISSNLHHCSSLGSPTHCSSFSIPQISVSLFLLQELVKMEYREMGL